MRFISFLFVLILSLQAQEAGGQDRWELQKQEDGISIYTSHQEDSRILSYRIEALIRGDLRRVHRQVLDFQGNKEYLERVKKIEVLEKDPGQRVLVYMLFDLPWPFRDRDFINRMDLKVGRDTISMRSSPATGFVEPTEGVVRMREFSEQWLLVRQGKGKTHLSLRGYADPGGKFPAWVVNLFVVQEPLSLVRGIKKQVERDPGS